MKQLEKIFQALADRNRLRILKMLQVRPMCVCEITAVLGIAQSSASRHLAILRDAGLIEGEKQGQWVIYSLARRRDKVVGTLLASLRQWGEDEPQVLSDRGKAGKVRREDLCAR